MSPRKRLDDWIDEEEYPDDQDVEDFGDESPVDYDPRTIGYYGKRQSSGFWTARRLILLVIVLLIVAALLLPQLVSLLR